MLHVITSEQVFFFYLRDSVSERFNIFYMFTYKAIVIAA